MISLCFPVKSNPEGCPQQKPLPWEYPQLASSGDSASDLGWTTPLRRCRGGLASRRPDPGTNQIHSKPRQDFPIFPSQKLASKGKGFLLGLLKWQGMEGVSKLLVGSEVERVVRMSLWTQAGWGRVQIPNLWEHLCC